MKKHHLLVVSHLGMGDHIIMNGLIRQLAKDQDLVVVPAKYANLVSVAYMYRDLPNVAVRPVIDHAEQTFFANDVWRGEVLWLGSDAQPFNSSQFDREFYRQADMSFQLRWDNFHFRREIMLEIGAPANQPYAFIHEDTSRGMRIDRTRAEGLSQIALPDQKISPNIFEWWNVVEHAAVVHCIPSSFSLLIDSMPRVPDQKLFLHKSARQDVLMPTFRHNWTIL